MYQAWQWPTAATDTSYVQGGSVPTVPTVAGTASTTATAGTWPAVPAYGQYAVPNAVQPQWAWTAAGQYGYAANMAVGQQVASQQATQTPAYSGGWASDSAQAPPPLPGSNQSEKPPLPPPDESSTKTGTGKITSELAPKDCSEDEKLKQLQAQAQQWTNQQQTSSWAVPPSATAAAAMSGSLTTAAMSMPPPTQTSAQWPQATWNQGAWTAGQWQQPQQQWPSNWSQQSNAAYKANEVPVAKTLEPEAEQKIDKPGDQLATTENVTKEHTEAIAALDKKEEEFNRQFQEWEKQFEEWKEQNINHPDKEAFANYERQWYEWREKLLKDKEHMSKKREEHLSALNKQTDASDSTSQNPPYSASATTTSENIPGLDLHEEKTSSGVTSTATSSSSNITTSTTVAASTTLAPVPAAPAPAVAAQGTATVSESTAYFPSTTQPQVPVPPQPYMFMPPQPFMYQPTMPPPPPHVLQQQFSFQNNQAPPPPMTGPNSNLNCPPPGPEMPPQKRPLLSTPAAGGLLPSPGSRFDNRPAGFNQMSETSQEMQQGTEDRTDQYGNEEPYMDRMEEVSHQGDWNFNEQNYGMNFVRGRGRGRGRGRSRGGSRWADNRDFEKPFEESLARDFKGNMNPARNCEDNFEGNMNPPNNFDRNMNPPRNFEGNANPPRGFAGNINPPRGFEGNMNPSRRFEGNMNPPRRFEGNMNPPRVFEGNMNPPRAFEGNLNPPRGFGGNTNPPRVFEGNLNPPPRAFEGNMNLPPRGFEGNMNPPPRGFEGNMNPPPRGFEGNMNPPHDFEDNFDSPGGFEGNVNPRGFEESMNPPRGFDGNMNPSRKFNRNMNAPRNFERNMKPPMRFEGMPPRDFDENMRPPRNFDGPGKSNEFRERFKDSVRKGVVDVDAFNPDACLLSTKFPPDPPADDKDLQEDFTSDNVNEGQFPPFQSEQFGMQERPIPHGRPVLREEDRFSLGDQFGPRNQHPFDQPFEPDFAPGPPPFNDRSRFSGKPFRDMEPPRIRNERFPPDRFGPEPFLREEMMMGPILDRPFPPEDEPFLFGFPDDRLPPKFLGDQGIGPYGEPEFGPDMRPPPFRDERFMDALHSNSIDYTHRPASNVLGDDFRRKYDAFDQQFGSDLINYRDSYYMGHIPPPPPPIIFSQVDVQAFDYNHGKKPVVSSTIQGKKSSKDSKSPFSNKAVFDYAHRRERSPYRDRSFRERDVDRMDRLRDHDRDKERSRDRERERDRNRDRDRSDRERDRDRDCDKERDRDRHRDRDRDRDKDRDDRRERDREERRDRDDRDRDRLKEKERDGSDKRSRWESREDSARLSMKDKSPESSSFRKTNGDRSRENKQPQAQLPTPDVFKNESSSEAIPIKDLLYPPNRFNRPKQLVIILRGLPGSGKTYVAKLIKDKELEHGGCPPRILSLDDYFMAEIEVTDTDPETGKKVKRKEFQYEYEACMEESYRVSLLRSFKKTIDERFFPFILVDAIHNESKHYEPMWSYAKQRGFQVYIAEMDCSDPVICHKRNIHNRTLDDIQKIKAKWEHKPKHFLSLDIRPLLQDVAIPEVEMEDLVESDQKKDDDDNIEDENNEASMPFHVPSRWEKLEATEERLDQLDGLRITKKKHSTMEDYLQLPDDYEERQCQPGKKRVRWADLEERKEQDRLRAIGFVVGQTDWSKLTDPTHADRALTRTKYI